MIVESPLAPGIPIHLLTERGLNEAFLDVVDRHRREELPIITERNGQSVSLPVSELGPEITRVQKRIAELSAEIAKYDRRSHWVNESSS